MSRAHLSRYVIRDAGGGMRIWDNHLEGYCSLPLPPPAVGVDPLAFPSRMEALDWLHLCHEAGLDILGHPGITIRVYEARDGSTTARHIRTVAERPGPPDAWPGIR